MQNKIIIFAFVTLGFIVTIFACATSPADIDSSQATQITDLQARLNTANERINQLEVLVKDLQKKLDQETANNEIIANERTKLLEEIDTLKTVLESKQNELLAQISKLVAEKQVLEGKLAEAMKESQIEKEFSQRQIDTLTPVYNEFVSALKAELDKGELGVTMYPGMLTLNISDVLIFNSGEGELNKKNLDILKKIGEIMKKMPDKILRIEGHTDDVPISPNLEGKYPNNWVLGAVRAAAVAVYFRDIIGIDPSRMVVISFAKYRPLVPNTTEENKAKNRRIELVVMDQSLYEMIELKQSDANSGQ